MQRYKYHTVKIYVDQEQGCTHSISIVADIYIGLTSEGLVGPKLVKWYALVASALCTAAGHSKWSLKCCFPLSLKSGMRLSSILVFDFFLCPALIPFHCHLHYLSPPIPRSLITPLPILPNVSSHSFLICFFLFYTPLNKKLYIFGDCFINISCFSIVLIK